MKSWSNLKKRLVADKLLHEFFVDPIRAAVASARTHVDSSIDYEPLLLESNLQQLSGHLDRALAFRREIQELEVLAVKAASEYALFKKQSPLKLELELLQLKRPEKAIGAKAHERAVAAFGDAPGLAKGFQEISRGTAAQYSSGMTSDDDQDALIRSLDRASNDYQDAYWQRHNSKGNAHNFGERAQLVGKLLGQDWLVAKAKAKAVAAGFGVVYGAAPPVLPDLATIDGLDDLVVWSRELVELVQSMTNDEIEVDLAIPLVQPRGEGGPSIVPKDAFNQALKDIRLKKQPFKLKFKLPAELFAMGTNVRLRRLGLAYGMRPDLVEGSGIDRNNTLQSPYRYRARIATPMQAAASDFPARRRPDVQLGNVTIYGAPIAYSEGVECMNLNPVGDWGIEIDPMPVVKDDLASLIGAPGDDSAWLDLKLFLRIRCKGAISARRHG